MRQGQPHGADSQRPRTAAMADTHWYVRFEAAAWIASTMTMSAEEAGAHMHLLMWSWLSGPIPDDDESLTRITRASAKVARRVLVAKWHLGDGGWTNDRLERERDHCADRSDSARASIGRRWKREPRPSVVPTAPPERYDRITTVIRETDTTVLPSYYEGNTSHSHSHSQRQSTEGECEGDAQRADEPQPSPQDSAREEPAPGAERIRWTPMKGWQGITDEYRASIANAYPAADLTSSLARMGAWLAANPAKARKKNWQRFISAWLARDQPARLAPTRSDY